LAVATTVRRALPVDSARLARINIRAWRTAYTGIVTPARLDSMRLTEYVERWTRTLTEDDPATRQVLVADLDGALASYCAGGPYRPQQGADEEDTTSWGEIYALYTDPALQGRGAGTAVHDAMLEGLRRDGFRMAALWVLEANQLARRWYADRGWRSDGATADWVSHGVAHPEVRLRRSFASSDAVSSPRTV
jgi:GNAT superfamily N-acetyltransferase